MILDLRNRNFQTHKDVTFKFSPGINFIVGPSRKGKTVVRRALTWLKDNRPIGNKYVSFWDRDDKKNPKTNHSVEISVDNKDDYYSISRIKAPDFNGYEVWNSESDDHGAPLYSFEAIGTDVPDEITKILNLSEVNIRKQWDQPFLLSESPGKVAEFFNKIIRLDIIDDILSEAETLRKRNEREIKQNKIDQEETTKQIESMSWTREASEKIKAIENFSDKTLEKEEKRDRIEKLINQYCKTEDELAEIPGNMETILLAMEEIEKLHEKIKEKEEKRDRISGLLEKYDKYCDELDELDKIDFKRAEQLMNDIEKLDAEIIKKETKEKKYEEIMDKFRDKHEKHYDITTIKEEIKDLLEQLPAQCPTCGQPVNKEMLI
jgi:exonuclease SbcC